MRENGTSPPTQEEKIKYWSWKLFITEIARHYPELTELLILRTAESVRQNQMSAAVSGLSNYLRQRAADLNLADQFPDSEVIDGKAAELAELPEVQALAVLELIKSNQNWYR